MINHQGVVSVNGQRFNGTGRFYFAIIDPDTGNSVWTNDATNIGTANRPNQPILIECANGLYDVRLGDLTSYDNMKPIPVNVFSSPNRTLRIWFDDGTNGVFQLTPDHALTSVPYAHKAAEAGGGVPTTIVFTASGTWTKPARLKYIEVEVIGGGGGGGGARAQTAARATGGGGGGGGYAKVVLQAGALGALETVTVAGGGSGGIGPVAGSEGGTSSFGFHVSASGGTGGLGDNGSPLLSQTAGGPGGFGFSGNINLSGESGHYGTYMSTVGDYVALSGEGGDSFLGRGGRSVVHTNSAPGEAGTGYGGGGSGAVATGTVDGGVGASGVVIVKEYY